MNRSRPAVPPPSRPAAARGRELVDCRGRQSRCSLQPPSGVLRAPSVELGAGPSASPDGTTRSRRHSTCMWSLLGNRLIRPRPVREAADHAGYRSQRPQDHSDHSSLPTPSPVLSLAAPVLSLEAPVLSTSAPASPSESARVVGVRGASQERIAM